MHLLTANYQKTVLSLCAYWLKLPAKNFWELSEIYVNHVTIKHFKLPLTRLSIYMALPLTHQLALLNPWTTSPRIPCVIT